MQSIWLNHEEAQNYAFGISNSDARSALRVIHQLLLECGESGLALRHFADRLTPAAPLNILTFYKLVADFFLNWNEGPQIAPSFQTRDPRFLRLAEAIEFAQGKPSQRVRAGLLRFLKSALDDKEESSEQLDLLFCCQLLSILLTDDQLLNDVLSGEAERRAVEFLRNPDTWFN